MGILKTKKSEIIFMLFNVILFWAILFKLYPRDIKVETLGEFVLVFIIYFLLLYLFDVFNLDKVKYKLKGIAFSFFINIILVFIFSSFFFTRKMGLTLFIVMFLFQVLYKLIIVKGINKQENMLFITTKSKIESHKKIITDSKIEGLYKIEALLFSNDITELLKFLNNSRDYLKTKNSTSIIIDDVKMKDNLKKELINLKLKGVKIYNFHEMYELIEGKIALDFLEDNWFLESTNFYSLSSSFYKKAKRIFDFFVAIPVAVIAMPIILIFAILIKLESKGPAFFVQIRIGEKRKPFKIIKLRSMRLHDEKQCSMYAGKKDNRITRIGKFIRKTRIDELPQIFNVLRGEMSFVGPRAEWYKLSKNYSKQIDFYDVRALVKPGITGWAQLNYPYGASLEDAKNKFEYDLYYVKHANIIMDISIFLRTISVVIGFKGQ